MTLDELKALAEKATPGPWTVESAGELIWHTVIEPATADIGSREYDRLIADCTDDEQPMDANRANAAYIAACSPDYILKLIACVKLLGAARMCAASPTDWKLIRQCAAAIRALDDDSVEK